MRFISDHNVDLRHLIIVVQVLVLHAVLIILLIYFWSLRPGFRACELFDERPVRPDIVGFVEKLLWEEHLLQQR
jgi:hypothetical protein